MLTVREIGRGEFIYLGIPTKKSLNYIQLADLNPIKYESPIPH